MATITATAAALVRLSSTKASPPALHSSAVLGLPKMGNMKGGMVKCSSAAGKAAPAVEVVAGGAAMLAAAVATPAMALVDERMSTEGTGLSLGISNNLLGWILLGVFALIWSLYTVYTSELEEDEESGLSL